MSEQELVKIELGCGRTKTEGYIGVDRFPMPGVDVVADMERGLPFPDDYADVIYACHSLEHIQNFERLMEEVYRICKDGALLFVLAPYSRTTLNSANFYHKTIFNENTFRFFTSNPIAPFDWQEYKCEQVPEWPLKGSDNSDCSIELTALHIEFFYYREYRALSPEERCNARHGLNDVCDQIFYVLAVNKGTEMLFREEQAVLLERAAQLEPRAIHDLRQRDEKQENGSSLIGDIQNWTDQKVTAASEILLETLQKSKQEARAELEATRKALCEAWDELLQARERTEQLRRGSEQLRGETEQLRGETEQLRGETEQLRGETEQLRGETEQLRGETEQLRGETEQLRGGSEQLRGETEQLRTQVGSLEQSAQELLAETRRRCAAMEGRQKGLAAHMLELARSGRNERRPRRVRLFRPVGAEFYEALRNTCPEFTDGLILHDFARRNTVPLTVSDFVPAEKYFEYPIRGYGKKLTFFLIGLPGSQVFAETVADDTITDQRVLPVDGDGVYQIEIPPVRGKAAIRFRLVDNSSMVRVIEVSRRHALLFSKRDLACFLSD